MIETSTNTAALAEKFWVASADMGYGHQRAVYPLKDIALNGEIITLGATANTSEAEQKNWKRMLRLYEGFSRASSIPVFGKAVFSMLDSLLYIPSYYPIRNLSRPTLQSKMLRHEIRKGLCSAFLNQVAADPRPVITSFFAPAIAADRAGHEGIYCIICDADINRVWVAEEPSESNIKYFAPCGKAAQRLRSYGVADNNIYITGFPLPESLIGGIEMPILKKNLAQRLANLDPKGKFRLRNEKSIEHFLGSEASAAQPQEHITITFAVGGAGAQKEIGTALVNALRQHLLSGTIHINLVVGVRKNLVEYYRQTLDKELLHSGAVKIICASELHAYFDTFNAVLQTTDILWTKPSELVFYTALGIPIIVAPVIGSQEQFNKHWLFDITSGIKQLSVNYTAHWLQDMLNSGRFAEAAWAGFLKARKLGTYKIREILSTGKMTYSDSPVHR